MMPWGMLDWRPRVSMPRGTIPTCRGLEAVPEPEHIWKALFHVTKVQLVQCLLVLLMMITDGKRL